MAAGDDACAAIATTAGHAGLAHQGAGTTIATLAAGYGFDIDDEALLPHHHDGPAAVAAEPASAALREAGATLAARAAQHERDFRHVLEQVEVDARIDAGTAGTTTTAAASRLGALLRAVAGFAVLAVAVGAAVLVVEAAIAACAAHAIGRRARARGTFAAPAAACAATATTGVEPTGIDRVGAVHAFVAGAARRTGPALAAALPTGRQSRAVQGQCQHAHRQQQRQRLSVAIGLRTEAVGSRGRAGGW